MPLTNLSSTDSPHQSLTHCTMATDIMRLVISLLLVTSSLCSQSFSSQPSDVTVSLGSDLTLPCVVVGRRGEVQVSRNIESFEFLLNILSGLETQGRDSLASG